MEYNTVPAHCGHPERRRLWRPLRLMLAVFCLALAGPSPAGATKDGNVADPILYWNDVSLEANRVSHTNGRGEQTGPPLSARALAIVHLSMYDAFAGALGNPPNLPPYLPGLPAAPRGASSTAAAGSAAHTALSALFPSQRPFFDAKLASAEHTGTPAEQDAGRAYGVRVAQALLADRSGDPGVSDAGYVPSTAPGRHQVDPDNPGQGFHAPFYGALARPFAVTTRHSLDAPPLPGDKEFRKAFQEVRIKGIAPELVGTIPAGGPKRTAEETLIGLFWAYDGAKGVGSPPRLYNQIIRKVAASQGNDAPANARLFALVNVAMADAGILAWEQKYIHDLCRPVVCIRVDPANDGPGGPNDDRDASWLPLGGPATNEPGKKNSTPPFPAYPSGHATFGAAAFQVTRLFYGVTADGPDKLATGLTFESDELNGVNTDNRGNVRPVHVRTFPEGLWGMIRENSVSRVFLGVHWVTDGFAPGPGGTMDLRQNVGGVRLGIDIANDIFGGGRAAGLQKSTL